MVRLIHDAPNAASVLLPTAKRRPLSASLKLLTLEARSASQQCKSQDRLDARGSNGTFKGPKLVGRFRVLTVINHMTTTRPTNTNTAGKHGPGYAR